MAKRVTLKLADILPQGRATTATPEQIKELAQDIADKGLKHPIIIFDGQVLDGLARIEAYKSLGLAEIPVMVSDRFDELTLALAKSRTSRLDTSRAVSLIGTLRHPMAQFVSDRRTETGSTKKPATGPAQGISLRELIQNATGLSQGRCELAIRLVRRAAIDPESAKRLQEVLSGQMTLYGYKRWFDRLEDEPLVEFEATVDEVRMVMDRGLRVLSTTVETISKFGAAEQLTLGERQKVMDSLTKSTQALRKLSKSIRHGMNSEMEEQ